MLTTEISILRNVVKKTEKEKINQKIKIKIKWWWIDIIFCRRKNGVQFQFMPQYQMDNKLNRRKKSLYFLTLYGP